jgi:multidrug efflux pump subunit AcrB
MVPQRTDGEAIGQVGAGKQVSDSFSTMASAMLVANGLVYLIMVILFRSVLMPVTGHATSIITGLAVSLQTTVLPVTVVSACMWIAYSVGGGLYGVACDEGRRTG